MDIVRDWLRLVTRLVDHNNEEKTIAVHCVAGLGRAPVLVAIALIELAGMEGLDAVEYVRDRRPGAFNKAQIAYLVRENIQDDYHDGILLLTSTGLRIRTSPRYDATNRSSGFTGWEKCFQEEIDYPLLL